MNIIGLIVAVLCGIVLIVEEDVGSLSQMQIAGIGIIALVVAGLAPATWPWRNPQ